MNDDDIFKKDNRVFLKIQMAVKYSREKVTGPLIIPEKFFHHFLYSLKILKFVIALSTRIEKSLLCL